MNTIYCFVAAGLAVLVSGAAAQAQHFHGHAHYHRGHYHLHGHWHYPSYYSYSGYPYIYGSVWSSPTYYYPSVATSRIVQPAPTIIPAAGDTTSTSLRPNSLPAYTGPGVTLRLPAEFRDPVFVRIDKRDIELKPGTEVTLKDRATYVVEFDRGRGFGAARHELTEGSYKMTVSTKANDLRRNTLPGEPKK